MNRNSRISLLLLVFLSLSALAIAAGNIREVVNGTGTEIAIYPNPVLGNEFNIKSEMDIVQVVVLNIVGQPVFKHSYIDQRKISIELETADRGVFIVQVKTANGDINIKRILLK